MEKPSDLFLISFTCVSIARNEGAAPSPEAGLYVDKDMFLSSLHGVYSVCGVNARKGCCAGDERAYHGLAISKRPRTRQMKEKIISYVHVLK